MDTGAGSSTIPNFTSNFPVDFATYRQPASTSSWYNSSRLTAGKELKFDGTNAETSWSKLVFDSNTGWQNHSGHGSSFQSWMWKRHAGFDCIVYQGDGVSTGRNIPHSLNAIPEMMIVKGRGPDAANWYVYHKAMGNGRAINLETTDNQSSESQARWNSTTPTSTHFSIGINPNTSNNNYLALLFSSVENISKVGSYSGSNSSQEISLGFQPRFVIIKKYINSSGGEHTGWYVLDTTRGWGSGNDEYLKLNSSNAQVSEDVGAPTSTGFTLTGGEEAYNSSGSSYLYYAHA
tara:strand:- start:30 stop:902 length:873 start_codon:yes stop_codon:yes gene_type:complete